MWQSLVYIDLCLLLLRMHAQTLSHYMKPKSILINNPKQINDTFL